MSQFGEYTVKIERPLEIYQAITEAIKREVTVLDRGRGLVNYRERSFEGVEPSPGNRMLMKPLKYEEDHEYRMFWIVNGPAQVEPRVFQCADLQPYCELLSTP